MNEQPEDLKPRTKAFAVRSIRAYSDPLNTDTAARAPMPTPVSTYDTEECILSGHVLNPLFDLGLMERHKPDEWPGIADNDTIQVSPLWGKFISFDLQCGSRTG
jgi:hypothetical protein